MLLMRQHLPKGSVVETEAAAAATRRAVMDKRIDVILLLESTSL